MFRSTVYTKILLHQTTLTQETRYTENLYTGGLSQQNAIKPETLYTKKLLRQTAFTPEDFLHPNMFTPRPFRTFIPENFECFFEETRKDLRLNLKLKRRGYNIHVLGLRPQRQTCLPQGHWESGTGEQFHHWLRTVRWAWTQLLMNSIAIIWKHTAKGGARCPTRRPASSSGRRWNSASIPDPSAFGVKSLVRKKAPAWVEGARPAEASTPCPAVVALATLFLKVARDRRRP